MTKTQPGENRPSARRKFRLCNTVRLCTDKLLLLGFGKALSCRHRGKYLRNEAAYLGGDSRLSEKEVLSALLTDPKETLKRLVAKAERVFRIDREVGSVVLLPPRTRLADRHVIAVHLLGKYFASKLELTQNDTLSIEELQKLTHLEEGSLSARLSELKKDGLVESAERGSYRVAYQNLESFGPLLDEIEKSTAGGSRSALPGTVSATEESSSINLAPFTDTDAIVLTLRANQAFPPTDKWLTTDEIVEWARNHGSLMRAETVTKYTFPQDATLRPFIIKRTEGRRRLYQLSRQGIEQAQRLQEREASEA